MTISKLAVENFLNQPRDNLIQYKGLIDTVLDEEIAALRPRIKWLPKLKTHQKVCLLIGIAYPELFFQMDMGTGKTLVSLVLSAYFIQMGSAKSLALVPMDEAIDSWLEEVEKWGFPYPVVALRGPGPDKVDAWFGFDCGLGIATYIGLATALSDLLPHPKKRNKREWVPNKDRIAKFVQTLDVLVLDESTKVAHRTSLSYTVTKSLSFASKMRFNLAGRPFGRDPVDLWAQFFLVDHGKTLGPTLGLYREALFRKTRARYGGPYSFNYKLDAARKDDFTRITAHRSIHYGIDECADLPPFVEINKRVSFPEETEVYYQRFVQDIIDSRGDLTAVKNAFLQMRQVSSGFLGFRDEDSEKIEIEFPHSPKFDLLMDMIEEIPDDQKAVIFYQFTHSGRKIHNALTKAGHANGWLWGGTKDWPTIKAKFDRDPNYRFLVIQGQKGSYALNLQAASIGFEYESSLSVIDREQSQRRIWRQGQERRVRWYNMMTRGSVDEKILHFHQEGGDLFKLLVSDPAKVFSTT